jgi:hypothetical protein
METREGLGLEQSAERVMDKDKNAKLQSKKQKQKRAEGSGLRMKSISGLCLSVSAVLSMLVLACLDGLFHLSIRKTDYTTNCHIC